MRGGCGFARGIKSALLSSLDALPDAKYMIPIGPQRSCECMRHQPYNVET